MRPPPGYPFVGDLPSRPPPPGSRDQQRDVGAPLALALMVSGAMMGMGFILVGLLAAEARHHAGMPGAAPPAVTAPDDFTRDTVEMPRAADPHDTSGGQSGGALDSQAGTQAGARAGAEARAPTGDVPEVEPLAARDIPVFPARFLEGCSAADLTQVEESVSIAIAHGAPLYNEGDPKGCGDVYEHTAEWLQAKLPAACEGPRKALSVAKANAGLGVGPQARAWAFRDAFDGLIDVLDRSRSGGVGSL
jgi:hypothetical protein